MTREQFNKVRETAWRYGWNAKESDRGYELTNRNGYLAAILTTTKSGRYAIAHPEGGKILGGNNEPWIGVGRVIGEYFAGKLSE